MSWKSWGKELVRNPSSVGDSWCVTRGQAERAPRQAPFPEQPFAPISAAGQLSALM